MSPQPLIPLAQLRELEPDATRFVELDHDWLIALIDTAEAAQKLFARDTTGQIAHYRGDPRELTTEIATLRETLARFTFDQETNP